MKFSLLILGLAMVFFATGITGGCAGPTSTSTTYYYPNWMSDGRIIATRERVTTSSSLWGSYPSDSKYHVVALTIDNNNLVKEEELFEITNDFGSIIAEEITCSPTGELIAYVSNASSGGTITTAGTITITNYRGENKHAISGVSGAKHLDWSPDAAKIVYSNASNELHMVNINGTSNEVIATSTEAVAWRMGNKIVYSFTDSESSKVYVIKTDGTSKEIIATIGAKPQIYQINRVVYGGYGAQVESVQIDGTEKQILFNYERSTLKLSFDNLRIVGGDLRDSGIVGVWVTNINNGQSTKIK